MQPAVGVVTWVPAHTVGALSSEEPPSTQVNLRLSVSLLNFLTFIRTLAHLISSLILPLDHMSVLNYDLLLLSCSCGKTYFYFRNH